MQEYLKESVQKSMEDFIDEMMNEDDWESTMLAKATLIHEAQLSLSKELNRFPSKEELCAFTKLSMDEIDDILQLSNSQTDK